MKNTIDSCNEVALHAPPQSVSRFMYSAALRIQPLYALWRRAAGTGARGRGGTLRAAEGGEREVAEARAARAGEEAEARGDARGAERRERRARRDGPRGGEHRGGDNVQLCPPSRAPQLTGADDSSGGRRGGRTR